MTPLPDEVLAHVFDFLTSHSDRNAVSLVSKSWYELERWSRKRVFIGNCYAISPERVIARFPRIKALKLKGKPSGSNLYLFPDEWGGFVHPWIEAMAKTNPDLEELRLTRMVVSDESLQLLSRSFPNFKSLVLVRSEGFTTDGLAAIASNCRVLRELDLQEIKVDDLRGQWLSCFPDSCTSLVSLNFSCLKGEVDLDALERLVARSPNLKTLKLNRTVQLETLYKILLQAPQLVDLGTGSYIHDPNSEYYIRLTNVVLNCKSVRSLSGFLEVAPCCLPAIYPLCLNLTSLNLSRAPGNRGSELIELIRHCPKLLSLWILDCIRDEGLKVVASTCKELQELKVSPLNPYGGEHAAVSNEGLLAISKGCPKLHSLRYECYQMTNAALITVAKNCPNLTRFELSIDELSKSDYTTRQPLDEGFGAIVQSCKGLRRLSLCGFLTDQVFLYIGMYAERLEMLSIACYGDNSNKGMVYILNGCKNLKKLAIQLNPFGDVALLPDIRKYDTMQYLWMWHCRITLGGCKTLAKKMPRLNVEIFDDFKRMDLTSDESQMVTQMYVYRTLDGARRDAPDTVYTL